MKHKQKIILNNVNLNNHDWMKTVTKDWPGQNDQPMALLNLQKYQLRKKNLGFKLLEIVAFLEYGLK